MDALLHQVFSGLATGCIYGLIGLALVMIYQATHQINFAQGEIATFSTFIAWALLQAKRSVAAIADGRTGRRSSSRSGSRSLAGWRSSG